MQQSLLETSISKLPKRPGIYIFRDETQKPLYIGKSKSIKERVKQYFTLRSHLGKRTHRLIKESVCIDYVETETEFEALLLEADYIKRYKPPFNTQWKDDKQYLYIKIQNANVKKKKGITVTLNEKRWPYVSISRRIDDPDALFFGPFPSSTIVRAVLRTLRRVFPWCKYASDKEHINAKRPCFYSHIGLCPGICKNTSTLKQYWGEIDHLVRLLNGNKKSVLKHYETLMNTASRKLDYETAAQHRDTISQLHYITQNFHSARDYAANINLKEDVRAKEIVALYRALLLQAPQDIHAVVIEGFDISNLGKTNTVGSHVVFVGGDPEKSRYRRYKINHKDLPDDFAAMGEMLSRRFKKLSSDKSERVDLILIDGGAGQLSVAIQAAEKYGITVPIFGLAKKEETLVTQTEDTYTQFTLPKTSEARALVQRIRDEAHRFAQRYHKLLRSKQMLS